MSVLFLGEAIVDLVCEQPVREVTDAPAFVPHCGGAIANAALVAARYGADVGLAGGVGEDAWGRWLEERLREAARLMEEERPTVERLHERLLAIDSLLQPEA